MNDFCPICTVKIALIEAGKNIGLIIQPVHRPVLVGSPDVVRHGLCHGPEFFAFNSKGCLGYFLASDVVPLNKDTSDTARTVLDRVENEIHE